MADIRTALQAALADRTPDAIAEFERAVLLIGEPEQALNQLEPLLRIPYYLTPAWLGIEPPFDPLRANPRFQRLVAATS